MCSFLVWKNACLNYREFDLEGDLVGVPHTWYLSAQSFIRLLKLVWREYDIVAMNEWKKKCVGLQRTWVSKRTVLVRQCTATQAGRLGDECWHRLGLRDFNAHTDHGGVGVNSFKQALHPPVTTAEDHAIVSMGEVRRNEVDVGSNLNPWVIS